MVGILMVDLPPAKFCESVTLPCAMTRCKELTFGRSAFLTRANLYEKQGWNKMHWNCNILQYAIPILYRSGLKDCIVDWNAVQ